MVTQNQKGKPLQESIPSGFTHPYPSGITAALAVTDPLRSTYHLYRCPRFRAARIKAGLSTRGSPSPSFSAPGTRRESSWTSSLKKKGKTVPGWCLWSWNPAQSFYKKTCYESRLEGHTRTLTEYSTLRAPGPLTRTHVSRAHLRP